MVDVLLRSVKGDPLTHNEVDANFTALANAATPNIVQAVAEQQMTISSTTPVDITDMSVTITPSSASSKILIMVALHADKMGYSAYAYLLRNGTQIGNGVDNAALGPGGGECFMSLDHATYSYTGVMYSKFLLDSPNTTSPITYKLQAKAGNAGFPVFINRSRAARNAADYGNIVASGMLAWEIVP